MHSKLVLIAAIACIMSSCQSIGQSLNELSGSLGRSPETNHTQRSAAQGANTATQTLQNQPADGPPQTASSRWQDRIIDTAKNAAYLTVTERRVIREINMVRTDPAAYAKTVLVPMRSLYHGKLLEYPGRIPIETQEGVSALNECIRVLESTRPLPPLSPKKGLYRAAHDQVVDQGKTGATGHQGSDGSTPETRISRYGHWGIALGENIDYGNAQARQIVTSLLIDDGVPDRGHRKNLLDPSFKCVGVAVGPHPVYRSMCVMDFVGSYE